jgi:hypothetical protein
LLVLSCIASLWVSGCSGDASSTAGPTPSVPTSSAPTSTPTPERETPEEFVRRWVEADTHMQNTGDGTEYRAMSAKCKNCLRYASKIEAIYEAGGYVKTAGWRIRSTKVGQPTPEGIVDVTISIHAPRTEYVEARGGPVQEFAGGDADYIVTLVPDGESWQTSRSAQVAR